MAEARAHALARGPRDLAILDLEQPDGSGIDLVEISLVAESAGVMIGAVTIREDRGEVPTRSTAGVFENGTNAGVAPAAASMVPVIETATGRTNLLRMLAFWSSRPQRYHRTMPINVTAMPATTTAIRSAVVGVSVTVAM
jgi:riboflavin biosynthesis pyrimidine reductase